MKNKLKYLLTISTLLNITACTATTKTIAPYYGKHIPIVSLLVEPIALQSKTDIEKIKAAKWFFEGEVKKGNEIITYNSCDTLLMLDAKGFKATNDREQAANEMNINSCNLFNEIKFLNTSKISYIDNELLTINFPNIAPPEFAFIISRDDERKLKSAKSWQEMSHIKKIEKRDEEQVIYYDNSGGMQSLSIVAKGDYNQDGIEDVIFSMENSVIEGSYSATEAYIITRLSIEAPYTLLKQL